MRIAGWVLLQHLTQSQYQTTILHTVPHHFLLYDMYHYQVTFNVCSMVFVSVLLLLGKYLQQLQQQTQLAQKTMSDFQTEYVGLRVML